LWHGSFKTEALNLSESLIFTSQRKLSLSITKNNRLLFTEAVTLSKTHKKAHNTLSVQNAQFLNVKALVHLVTAFLYSSLTEQRIAPGLLTLLVDSWKICAPLPV
jgi:hypothetical protein